MDARADYYDKPTAIAKIRLPMSVNASATGDNSSQGSPTVAIGSEQQTDSVQTNNLRSRCTNLFEIRRRD
jgi:hypothetical protein